jgi:hypothetical protein
MDTKLDRRRPMAFSLVGARRNCAARKRSRHRSPEASAGARHAHFAGEQGTAEESRAALAWIDLQEGKAGRPNAGERSGNGLCRAEGAGNEATTRATLALALLAQGKRDQAGREIASAQALVKPQHVMFRLPLAVAAARVTAARGPRTAVRSLEEIRAESVRRGIPASS